MKTESKFNALLDEIKVESPEYHQVIEESQMLTRLISLVISTRKEMGISQRDLANLTGLKQAAIGRLETLHSVPRIDTLIKIFVALNLNVDLNPKTYKEAKIYRLKQKNEATYKKETQEPTWNHAQVSIVRQNLGSIA